MFAKCHRARGADEVFGDGGAGALAARSVFVALVLLTVLPSAADASEPDSTRTARFLWRGRPRPECTSFLITEVGFHYLLNPASPWRERPIVLTGDLGYMRNRNKRSAVGGLLHLGIDYVSPEDMTGVGVAFRYRRWLSQWGAVDLTVGLDVLGSVNPGHELGRPAPWVEAGVSVEDILALSVRGEHWTRTTEPLFPDGSKGSKGFTTWHVGAKGGSYLGAVAAVGIGVTAAILLVALAGGN